MQCYLWLIMKPSQIITQAPETGTLRHRFSIMKCNRLWLQRVLNTLSHATARQCVTYKTHAASVSFVVATKHVQQT